MEDLASVKLHDVHTVYMYVGAVFLNDALSHTLLRSESK